MARSVLTAMSPKAASNTPTAPKATKPLEALTTRLQHSEVRLWGQVRGVQSAMQQLNSLALVPLVQRVQLQWYLDASIALATASLLAFAAS